MGPQTPSSIVFHEIFTRNRWNLGRINKTLIENTKNFKHSSYILSTLKKRGSQRNQLFSGTSSLRIISLAYHRRRYHLRKHHVHRLGGLQTVSWYLAHRVLFHMLRVVD